MGTMIPGRGRSVIPSAREPQALRLRRTDMKARIRTARRGGVSLAVAAAIGLALAGCGSEVAGGSSAGGSTAAGSSATTPGSVVTPTRDPGDPTDPTIANGGLQTLVGTVIQGAEPSCLILQTESGQFELLAPKPVPHEGDKVKVVGHVVKAMSHCMQGQPFLVEQLTVG
jgi:hypothetical protein